jgi:hypothetical protein
MRTITLFGLLFMLTTISAVAPASACPSGYVRCGGACCPR